MGYVAPSSTAQQDNRDKKHVPSQQNTSLLSQEELTREEIEIDVDRALELAGSCGRFQYLIQILVTFILVTLSYHSILSYFIANDPPWRCKHLNSTSSFCGKHLNITISTENEKFTRRCDLSRQEWEYVTDKKYSIVTEFDLVCGRTWIAALSSSIFHIGGGVGIFIAGMAADYLGRKYVLISALIVLTGCSITCSYLSTVWQLIAVRLFLGAAAVSSFNVSFSYLSEFIPPNRRTITSIVFRMGFVASQVSLAGAASYLIHWRSLQLYASLPCILGIALLFIAPESPRWLLVNGKHTEARNTIQRIGTCNGIPLPSITLKSPSLLTDKRFTYWDLFRNRKVAIVTSLLSFIWLAIEMSYYAITFESSNIGGDIYQAFVFSSLAVIPGLFIAYYTYDRFGRRNTVLTCVLLAGVCAISTTLIPHAFSHRYLVKIIMLMLAKLFIDIADSGAYIWSFEIFPTVVRLQGVGVCLLFAKLGSFVAPFLTSVLHEVDATLPYIVIMVAVVLAAGACLLLPETNNKATREHYEDFFDTCHCSDRQGTSVENM